jgi:hypothetical protein
MSKCVLALDFFHHNKGKQTKEKAFASMKILIKKLVVPSAM